MRERGADASWEDRERALVDLARPLILGSIWVRSFTSVIIGLVYGITLLVRAQEEENRKTGVACLALAAANVVLVGLVVALYLIVVMAAVISLGRGGV